jgi:hypothetical protein
MPKNKSDNKIVLYVLLVIFILPVLSDAASASSTIAFVADAKPALGNNLSVLIGDFNQIIPQSSTGQVDAVVMVGDMNPIASGTVNTEAAYAASTARNIPAFYVVGNHELNNINDLPTIKSKFASYAYSPKPGPAGSRNTTYSFDVGDIHVVVLNEYWNGGNNSTCTWYVPSGGPNVSDGCFKYNTGDGGFIPDELYDWLENDLSSNTKNWTVVVGHEPLYPWGNHIGNSLDENTTNRDNLENLFISKNVTAFIGGHTHIAGFKTIDNIFHVNAGLMGDNVGKGNGDNFSTIVYITVNQTGHFIIEQKSGNPIWNTPDKVTLTKAPATLPFQTVTTSTFLNMPLTTLNWKLYVLVAIIIIAAVYYYAIKKN